MAKKRSKRYRKAAELIEEDKVYSLSEGIETLKKFPSAKYDETVSISLKFRVVFRILMLQLQRPKQWLKSESLVDF